jgi:hypothetical protein
MNQENAKKVDPKEFLGAKVISPLEQEKLIGGTAEDDTKKKEKVKKKEKAVE